MVLLAIGLGLAMPGYAAAATLAVPPEQHGSISGMVNATNGLTWIIGPVLGTALYERSPATPIVAALVLCLVASAAVWRPASGQRESGRHPRAVVVEPEDLRL
jgi:MFS family permease